MAYLSISAGTHYARSSASQSNLGTANSLTVWVCTSGTVLLGIADGTLGILHGVGSLSAGVLTARFSVYVERSGTDFVFYGFTPNGGFRTLTVARSLFSVGVDPIIRFTGGDGTETLAVYAPDGTVLGTMNNGPAGPIGSSGSTNGFISIGADGNDPGFVSDLDGVAMYSGAKAYTGTAPTSADANILFLNGFDQGSGASAVSAVGNDLDDFNAGWAPGGTWDGGTGGGGGPTIVDLTGTLAGTSTASGAISTAAATAISGTLAGTSTMAGEIDLDIYRTQTLAGTSSMSGAISVGNTVDLTGTLAGTSAASGAATAVQAVAGTVAGTSSLSGAATAIQSIAGTAAGTSDLSGAATQIRAAAGTLAGTSAMSGEATLDNTQPISGTAAGTSALTGAPSFRVSLSGTLGGTSAMSGQQSGTVALIGSLDGTSLMAGVVTFIEQIPSFIATPGTRSLTATPGARTLVGTPTGR